MLTLNQPTCFYSIRTSVDPSLIPLDLLSIMHQEKTIHLIRFLGLDHVFQFKDYNLIGGGLVNGLPEISTYPKPYQQLNPF